MRILIITDRKEIKELLSDKAPENKCIEIEFQNIDNLKELKNKKSENYLIYIDVNLFGKKNLDDILNNRENLWKYGIIDFDSELKDSSYWIAKGFFDYLNQENLLNLINIDRLKGIESFKSCLLNGIKCENQLIDDRLTDNIVSGWDEIEEDKEYTFWILFVGIDNINHIIESYSLNYRREILNKFRNFVENVISSGNGRIWMWNEHGGLILFPFNGRCEGAFSSALRLILNKSIFGFEMENSIYLKYHVVFHRGKTIFKKRGRTGTVISDDINKIFHIGTEYISKSSLCITENAFNFLPDKAKNAFVEEGFFEGEKIYSFKYLGKD